MLVGGIPTPLKNMKVSWDDYAHILWKNKRCSKPPTRYEFHILISQVSKFRVSSLIRFTIAHFGALDVS